MKTAFQRFSFRALAPALIGSAATASLFNLSLKSDKKVLHAENRDSTANAHDFPKKQHPCTRQKRFDPSCPELVIFAGNSNYPLAKSIVDHLGRSLGKSNISRFNDGEVNVKIDESVRGKDVYLIQSTSPPVNDNLIELLLTVSALRRASAKRVTVIVPYFGYIRSGVKVRMIQGSEASKIPMVSRASNALSFQSKLHHSFKPDDLIDEDGADGGGERLVPMFAASDVARMMEVSGVHRVVVVDLQAPGLGIAEGFFREAQVDSVTTSDVVPEAVKDALDLEAYLEDGSDLVVVAPHTAAVPKAQKFRQKLEKSLGPGIGLATMISTPKRDPVSRRLSQLHKSKLELVGDVKGKVVLVVEDIIDTGNTTIKAVNELKAKGATKIFTYATHGLLSGQATARLNSSPVDKIVVLDTVPISQEKLDKCPKLQVISIASVLGDLIKTLHYHKKTEELPWEEESP